MNDLVVYDAEVEEEAEVLTAALDTSKPKLETTVEWFVRRMWTHPTEFQQTEYTLRYKPNGMEIWTKNGFFSYDFYSGGPKMTWCDKWKFHRAYRKWFARAMQVILNED